MPNAIRAGMEKLGSVRFSHANTAATGLPTHAMRRKREETIRPEVPVTRQSAKFIVPMLLVPSETLPEWAHAGRTNPRRRRPRRDSTTG